MPVSFLRTPADYLGISEAPQKPLFQQTNALQQGAADEMNFFNQMVGLRQQRPLAQAQAIQNQYSTIFNNAEKLRLEQQAAREAEQAVSSLVGIKPESDTYLQQKADIQRQFPLASLDPRVQRIFQDNDEIYRSRQGAIAKQQQEAADRRAKLFGMGATPQQVEAVFQNPDAAAQLEFQLGKGTSGKGNAATLKSAVDLLNDEIKAMSEAGEDYEMVGEQQVMKPEYKALLDRRNKYRDAYLGELDKTMFPQQATTTTKEVEKPVVPPAPTSFMDTMKKGAGQTPAGEGVVPSLTLQEEIEDINSIADDPNALIEAVRSGNRSVEAKKVALEKLKEFQKKLPTFEFKTGTPEQISDIKRSISGLVEEAKSEIELEPFRQEVNKAWTTEKKNIQSQIKDFAKALGVAPELAESWLAQNVTYTTEFDPTSDAMPRKIAIRDYFDEYLQNRVGKSLRDEADIITRLSGNKYASKLGIGKSKLAKGLVSQVLAPFLGPFAYSAAEDVAPDKGPTYGRMLDAYLNERTGQSQAPQQVQEEVIVSVSTKEEVDALPKGSKFRGPDGKVRIKES